MEETTYGRFAAAIRERGLASSDAPVLLMVSGGSDSTALAYLANDLHAAGELGPLGILHVNHKLRGEDSDGDARFVQRLAEALDLPFFLREVDVGAVVRTTGGNMEAVAREERYRAAHEALSKLCQQIGSPVRDGRIFTAHTQDDRVENFYMRSIVGTGPGGFRSMRYANGQIMRPCLDTSRDDLQAFLHQRVLDARTDPAIVCVVDDAGAPWRTDATNDHTDQFRTYVRNAIVPAAKERNPQLLDTLCRSMNLIADEDDMLDVRAQELLERDVRWLDTEMRDGLNYASGCSIAPRFGEAPLPMRRRVIAKVLQLMLGLDARVETATVEACANAFADGAPISGYTGNIQGDYALSTNKKGLLVEPMEVYRARRKN